MALHIFFAHINILVIAYSTQVSFPPSFSTLSSAQRLNNSKTLDSRSVRLPHPLSTSLTRFRVLLGTNRVRSACVIGLNFHFIYWFELWVSIFATSIICAEVCCLPSSIFVFPFWLYCLLFVRARAKLVYHLDFSIPSCVVAGVPSDLFFFAFAFSNSILTSSFVT